MALQFTTSYLEDAVPLFRHYKNLAEGAMAQVGDEQLYISFGAESNSIATLVKHLAGNMLSRWTDFLTTDGEKPDRKRDSEFVRPPATRAELMALWERGWNCLFSALLPLNEDDLTRTVTIRGERHSVMQAIHRQIAHSCYHSGQIVFAARQLCPGAWKSLSVSRGESEQWNRKVLSGEASQR